MLYQQCP